MEWIWSLLPIRIGQSPTAWPKPRDVSQEEQEEYEDREDYKECSIKLHRVLREYCLCRSNDSKDRQIQATLRLSNGKDAQSGNGAVDFGLFFLRHPHERPDGPESQWQGALICVSKDGVESPTSFNDPPPYSPLASSAIRAADFCEYIREQNEAVFRFALQSDQLFYSEAEIPSRDFLTHLPSVPLSDILDDKQLSERVKTKLLLSCHLARAAWMYYDSDWMLQQWTNRSVHFMFECRPEAEKAVFVDEPFLHADLHNNAPREGNPKFNVHRFPKVLALGIMLLEIELGISIELCLQNGAGYFGKCAQLPRNADHILAMRFMRNPRLWRSKGTFDELKNTIEFCLVPDNWRHLSGHPEQVRKVLYERVVSPLWKLYQGAWEHPNASTANPILIGEPAPNPPLIPRPQATTCSTGSVGSEKGTSPTGNGVSETRTEPASNRWFQQLDKFKTVTRYAGDRDGLSPFPKFAILDTGLDPECAKSKEFVKFVDFATTDNTTCRDDTGHGTSIFRLLRKVNPDVRVFVGRVWENNQATGDTAENTASLMTKAIRHAVDVWNVDIVIMSSGFESHFEHMQKAIRHANESGVLVFAAAHNHGNLRNIAFPARLYRASQVLCMFATDGGARGLTAFNPSPLAYAPCNLAILGEHIDLGSGARPLSGTSFSTVVGAAVAGRLVDFARHPDVRAKLREPGNLTRVEGMSSVFRSMAVRDGCYWCVVPWEILPPMDKDALLDMENRAEVRRYVRESISRALEATYRT